MLVKRSTAEIEKVLDDKEHNLDDEETKKALAEAKKTELEKEANKEQN